MTGGTAQVDFLSKIEQDLKDRALELEEMRQTVVAQQQPILNALNEITTQSMSWEQLMEEVTPQRKKREVQEKPKTTLRHKVLDVLHEKYPEHVVSIRTMAQHLGIKPSESQKRTAVYKVFALLVKNGTVLRHEPGEGHEHITFSLKQERKEVIQEGEEPTRLALGTGFAPTEREREALEKGDKEIIYSTT